MLTLALAATLVGFALLVVGLFTGTVWLAVACIVVCLIGLAFLLVDILGIGRRRRDRGATSDPDVGATVGGDAVSENGDRSPRPAAEAGAQRRGADATPGVDDVPGTTQNAPHSGRHERPSAPAADRTDMQPGADRQGLWRGVVSPGAQAVPDAASNESAAPTAPGTLDDYLATVGESPSRGATEDPADYPPARSTTQSVTETGGWPSYSSGVSGPVSSGPANPEAPAESGRHSGAQGREKFDPLDPRWRPPAD